MVSSTITLANPPPDPSSEDDDWMFAISKQFVLPDGAGGSARTPLSNGDRATLRRMEIKRSDTAAGAVIKLLAGAGIPDAHQIAHFARWRLMAHVTSVLSGTGKLKAHSGRHPVGTVLEEAGYSEIRLLRLLAARGDALHDQVRQAVRIIAQKRKQPVNLWTIYHLLSADPVKAESARITIAQDYYSAARKKQGTTSDD